MSCKRRRHETSWDMKQDKRPPDEIGWQDKDRNSSIRSEANDPGRLSREGNRNRNRDRNLPKDDDISRDRHRTFDDEWEKQYTTRPSDDSYALPYRDRSRSPNRRESRSPFCDDRHKSNEYGDRGRNNSRSSSRPCKDFAAGDRRKGSHSRGDNLKESWSGRPDHSGGQRYGRFPPHGDYHRNQYDDGDGRRQSNRISKIQCKFFSAGKCYRDDCKFSHDVSDSQDYDNIRGHNNRSWHGQQPHADLNASDLSEKNKSWDGSSWDFDENKKKSWDGPSWDGVSNTDLDNKNRSWNGPSWDEVNASGFTNKPCHNSEDTKSWNATSRGTMREKSSNNLDEKTKSWNGSLWDEVNVRDGISSLDNKMRKWDDPGLNEKGFKKNDDFLPQQFDVVNDSHLNNCNILSEEANQQILTSEKGQVENGKKSPKKKQELAQNGEQEQETFNPEKGEEGIVGNDENCTRQCRSPLYDDRHKSNEYGNHVRNNSRGDNLKENWSHKSDYSRYSHNINSRNQYDDDDGDDDDDRDGRRQSNRISKVQCKFFSAGNCHRDDCKFSHDVPDSQHHDRRSHDNIRAHKNMPHASDLSERNKSWDGPTWDDVESKGFHENKKRTWDSHNSDEKKKSTRDDESNPNLDNRNRSWNGPSWNEVDENRKSWAQMDNENRKWDEKGSEKSQHNVVNDSHLNNGNVLFKEANQLTLAEQNLANAIDYLKSLPDSAHKQDTRPKEEGKIGNDVMEKSPKKKTVAENAKQEEENVKPEKVDEGNIGNDEKYMRPFRTALVELVKEVLKPKWKEGRMTREVYKTVVKKVVDKVTSSIQGTHIPTTEAKIDQYLTRSKPKIIKLLEAYVEKLVKP